MSYRLAVALACASAACLKAPPFQGIGDDGGPGDGNGNGNGDAIASAQLEQWAYIKADAPEPSDLSGIHIAISSGGTTLAVGAPTTVRSGAVFVFVGGESGWRYQSTVTAANAGAADTFGAAVALSADGNTLVVGAPAEDNLDNDVNNAGAAYVFVRTGTTWTQQAYLKATYISAGDRFGTSVALSNDGNTAVVGAPYEDGVLTGVQAGAVTPGETETNSGAAYVFERTGTNWGGTAYIKATNTDADDQFGSSVAISGDASMIAVGAPLEDSGTQGIDTTSNENASAAGAVYVYLRSAPWTPHAYIKPSNAKANWVFGTSLALSSDGGVMAVGAPGDDTTTTGVNGDQTTFGALRVGAVFVFERNTTWSQSAYLKASNPDENDEFGKAVALAEDGMSILVGAWRESSNATGLEGDQTNDTALYSGAAYLFEKDTQWQQTAYIKGSNTEAGDQFGFSVALSDVASTFAVGAPGEDSSGSVQILNDAADAGAAYVFRKTE